MAEDDVVHVLGEKEMALLREGTDAIARTICDHGAQSAEARAAWRDTVSKVAHAWGVCPCQQGRACFAEMSPELQDAFFPPDHALSFASVVGIARSLLGQLANSLKDPPS
jgi:hypothetical protein